MLEFYRKNTFRIHLNAAGGMGQGLYQAAAILFQDGLRVASGWWGREHFAEESAHAVAAIRRKSGEICVFVVAKHRLVAYDAGLNLLMSDLKP